MEQILRLRKRWSSISRIFLINCLEGSVQGTAINNNDKNINEIISDSIKKTVKIFLKKTLFSLLYTTYQIQQIQTLN